MLVRDDELGGNVSLIDPMAAGDGQPPAMHRGSSINSNAVRMIRPRDSLDRVPSFWVQRNNVYWNTNIKLLLTNIGNVGLFIGLILFAHTANHKYLYFSMSLDLICQLVTWKFLIKDGIHFGLAKWTYLKVLYGQR